MKVLLDHSIVGQDLTTMTFNKERRFAACRLCGAIFQPDMNTNRVRDTEYTPKLRVLAEREIKRWREEHNKTHTGKEHLDLAASGMTFTPEAAYKLAPFGLVPVRDVELAEIAHALFEAPRSPLDDAEGSLKHYVGGQ